MKRELKTDIRGKVIHNEKKLLYENEKDMEEIIRKVN